MRLWVLLNMETPEKKPASSTAKRPRVTASAATSLRRGRGWAQASGLLLRPLHSHPKCSLHVLLPVLLGGERERQAGLDVAVLESEPGKENGK